MFFVFALHSGWSPAVLFPPSRWRTLEDVEPIKVDISKEWLSVADICEYMDVSTFVVTTQLRAGAVPAVKFGREWRVARQDFEDWLNAQRMESSVRGDGGTVPVR